jgi:hypothetical protein
MAFLRSFEEITSSKLSIRWTDHDPDTHPSAYVSIRQRMRPIRLRQRLRTTTLTPIRPHTSAYVSIRQHTSAHVSIRQHTSAYVSIRQHPSLRQYLYFCSSKARKLKYLHCGPQSRYRATSAYVSIRQHTSAYVSIRQHKSACVSVQQQN